MGAERDLEKANLIQPNSIRVSFTSIWYLFLRDKHELVIEKASEVIEEAESDEKLIALNQIGVKKIFQHTITTKLTIDEFATCYLLRAKSLAKYKKYELGLEDIQKSLLLMVSKDLKIEISVFKSKVLKLMQAEKEQIALKRKQQLQSKLDFRLKNSFTSMPEVIFWVLYTFLVTSSVTCYVTSEILTAYKLFGLSFLIFPPTIIVFSWIISRFFPTINLIHFEKSAYFYFLILFFSVSTVLTVSSMSDSYFVDNSAPEPTLDRYVSVGMDSDRAVDKINMFAKDNGGEVDCRPKSPMYCEYKADNGKVTLVHFEHEFTYYAMNPRKTKVTQIEYRY